MTSASLKKEIKNDRALLESTAADYHTVKSMIRAMQELANKQFRPQKVELRKVMTQLENRLRTNEELLLKETGQKRRGRPRIHFNNEKKTETTKKQTKLVRKNENKKATAKTKADSNKSQKPANSNNKKEQQKLAS